MHHIILNRINDDEPACLKAWQAGCQIIAMPTLAGLAAPNLLNHPVPRVNAATFPFPDDPKDCRSRLPLAAKVGNSFPYESFSSQTSRPLTGNIAHQLIRFVSARNRSALVPGQSYIPQRNRSQNLRPSPLPIFSMQKRLLIKCKLYFHDSDLLVVAPFVNIQAPHPFPERYNIACANPRRLRPQITAK